MAMLFGKGRTTITEHIGNIFKEGELNEKEVCRLFDIPQNIRRLSAFSRLSGPFSPRKPSPG